MRTFKRKRRSRGQGTIEMILTLFAFFTIFFMFVQIGLSFAVANYIQYATFMAGRAFLAGYTSIDEQKQAAQDYIDKMLNGRGGNGRFGNLAKPEGDPFIGPSSRVQLGDNAQARDTSWEQGVSYPFRIKLYLAPLIPGISRGQDSTVLLESQGILGREPTEQDCEKILKKREDISGAPGPYLYDNGC